jgi:ubiquitin carboxyl-terminal hydrolase 25/28
MDEPEMDLGDAYAVYRVPDRSAAIDLDVLNTQLAICEPGEKPKFEKAYALIQQDQVQRFGSNPNNANLPDVRRNNFALDTWPVGLRNIGNTCYLNSVLQFLFTVKPLRDLILDCEKHMEDPSPEALKEKKVGRQAVTVERVLVAQKCQYIQHPLYSRANT